MLQVLALMFSTIVLICHLSNLSQQLHPLSLAQTHGIMYQHQQRYLYQQEHWQLINQQLIIPIPRHTHMQNIKEV